MGLQRLQRLLSDGALNWAMSAILIVAGLSILAYALYPHGGSRTLERPFWQSEDATSNVYRTTLGELPAPPFKSVPADDNEAPRQSNLQLFEDGRPLGPAHSAHSRISAEGAGHYSFWKGTLYLSTSDNTNPNEQARTYTVQYRAEPVYWLPLLGLGLIGAGVVLLARLRGTLSRTLGRIRKTRPWHAPGVRRADWSAGALVSIIGAAIVVLGVSVEPAARGNDGDQYLMLGERLAQRGDYTLGGQPYYRREPVLPVSIALLDEGFSLFGIEGVSTECLSDYQTEACQLQKARYNLVFVPYLALAAFCAGLLVLLATRNRLYAGTALGLTLISSALLTEAGTAVTEIPAASLSALAGVLAFLAFRDRQIRIFAALGIVCGLLALTKVVFAYLWIAFILVLPLTWLSGPRRIRATALCALALASGFYVPAGLYMARNVAVGGEFALSERRSAGVLSVRASYNEMTTRQWLAGFLFYTPAFQPEEIEALGFSEDDYALFDTSNPEGFRRRAQAAYRADLAQYQAEFLAQGDPDATGRAHAAVSQDARQAILADPIAHLRASIVLAYRALFIDWGFGDATNLPGVARNHNAWSIEAFPSLSYRMDPFTRSVWNITTGMALVLTPLVWAILRRNPLMLAALLPALYLHATYGAASHFLPRYAVPEAPLRYAAVLVLAALLLPLAWKLALRTEAFTVSRLRALRRAGSRA